MLKSESNSSQHVTKLYLRNQNTLFPFFVKYSRPQTTLASKIITLLMMTSNKPLDKFDKK